MDKVTHPCWAWLEWLYRTRLGAYLEHAEDNHSGVIRELLVRWDRPVHALQKNVTVKCTLRDDWHWHWRYARQEEDINGPFWA